MTDYHAPVRDMRFVLDELCDLEGLNALPPFTDVTPDLVEQILNESARFTGYHVDGGYAEYTVIPEKFA